MIILNNIRNLGKVKVKWFQADWKFFEVKILNYLETHNKFKVTYFFLIIHIY